MQGLKVLEFRGLGSRLFSLSNDGEFNQGSALILAEPANMAGVY